MNAAKAASRMRWRAGISSASCCGCFRVDLVAINLPLTGTIWYHTFKRLVPYSTSLQQCVQGGLAMAKPVLVTSAAGGLQGKTGRHVAEKLLARGVAVRAFVRQIDERSDKLRALGAEIFQGDFLDVRSVKRAVQDVSSVYFAYPVQDGLLDATAAMAVAAREAGISRLVNLVMLQSSVDAPTPRMRQNFLSEQVFEWAGVGPLHLRATVFYENVARLVGAGMPTQGAIRLPLGDQNTILPLISAEAVSRIAVG